MADLGAALAESAGHGAREVQGAEAVHQALALGRGVILFTAHLGPWEAAVLYTGQRWPITGMYRALRNPGMDALMRRGRERSGARQLNKERGVRPLCRLLKKKEVVGILTDQNVDPREGVFAPFFCPSRLHHPGAGAAGGTRPDTGFRHVRLSFAARVGIQN